MPLQVQNGECSNYVTVTVDTEMYECVMLPFKLTFPIQWACATISKHDPGVLHVHVNLILFCLLLIQRNFFISLFQY